ncbi:MAG: peptidase C69 [Bacteroidetes bacterium 4572_77]|nr:MAG: peptidase C69 [Bacteroidetes bacterium 4572_77]
MLKESVIKEVLSAALSTGGDFAEIFMENRVDNNIVFISGKIDTANSGRTYGVGIRIINGKNSIYGYTNNTSRENLIKLAKDVAMSISDVDKNLGIDLVKEAVEIINPVKTLPSSILKSAKVDWVKKAASGALGYSDKITQVSGRYNDFVQDVLIANSEGLLIEDRRVSSRLMVSAVATNEKGEMQTGMSDIGASMGLELYENASLEDIGKEAARVATTMVDADYSPSGKMTVVIDNAFGGVIFHEACGHGLEATSVAKGNSVYAGKLGEKIASELVTAIDDATIPNGWGSFNVNDEGEKPQKNILFENGVLKNYMIDRLGSVRMGMKQTGAGRRESYKYAPTSRMSNTFIAPGKSSHDEIIANTEYGLYAKKLGGGSVQPATGEFNFSVQEGYIIKDGKISHPVKGATLIGTGLEVIKNIDMVGNELKYGQGMCGSLSGSIQAWVGQPMIRVQNITVGGRK